MQAPSSRQPSGWPRKVRFGRVTVTIYKRQTPSGLPGFLVANYSTGKRRLDSYPDEDSARAAALELARQLSAGEVLAVSEGEYRACLALLAFAGLRPDEARQLRWENVSLGEGDICVTGRGSKTRSHRHVPVLDPLPQWLSGLANPVGPVWSGTAGQLTVARRAGWIPADDLESRGGVPAWGMTENRNAGRRLKLSSSSLSVGCSCWGSTCCIVSGRIKLIGVAVVGLELSALALAGGLTGPSSAIACPCTSNRWRRSERKRRSGSDG